MRLLAALLLAAVSAPALAQQPAAPASTMPMPSMGSAASQPNAAPAPAPVVPGVAPQAAGGSVFSPNRAVAAAAIGVPQAQNAPGFQSAPLPSGPGTAQPMPAGNPNMGGAPVNTAAGPGNADIPLEVPAVFVGRFNGMNVFRASNGSYMFEKGKRPKVVAKETSSIPDTVSPQPAHK